MEANNVSQTEYMKNRYKYFKWTPRIGGLVAIYMVLIPGSMAYLFAKTDVSAFPLRDCWVSLAAKEAVKSRYRAVHGC